MIFLFAFAALFTAVQRDYTYGILQQVPLTLDGKNPFWVEK